MIKQTQKQAIVMIKIVSFIVVMTIIFLSKTQAQENVVFNSPLEINGVQQADSILCVQQNSYYSCEAKELMEAVDGNFYPYADGVLLQGFSTQYGKIISYTFNNFPNGISKSLPLEMHPPAQKIEYEGSMVQFAPINFLSKALGDTVYFDETSMILKVFVNPPDTIGSVIPNAAPLSRSLQQNGNHVRHAGIDLTNAITMYAAGYATDCNGNNAGFPYIIINMPPAQTFDTLYNSPSLFNLRNDEAIIVIGKTPPKCKYFSYRSYLGTRFYYTPNITAKKIFASLGDTKSCYSMNENVAFEEMFERDFAIISTADSSIANTCKQMILETTNIPEIDIYFDVIPSEIFRFGFMPDSDMGVFLHRVSIFSNDSAGTQYVNNPTLEVLRITPETQSSPVFIPKPPLTSRITGNDEFYLTEDFEYLEQAIFNQYTDDFDISYLAPSVWLMEGYQAIQEMEDVLGEVRDALYIRTEAFSFKKDDIIVVYGVNHTKTGKAVYTNVSCYRDSIYAGYGGITNTKYENTAWPYFTDSTTADNFFVYKFTRDSLTNDTNIFIVPPDTANNFLGINYGDQTFMAFRAYIDTLSKVGPSPLEIIFSRAMLLRQIGSGFDDIKIYDNIELKIFPNPAKDFTEFEITTGKHSLITISIYNLSGQLIDIPIRNKKIINTDRIRWDVPENLNKGVYIVRIYSIEEGSNRMNCMSQKVVVN